MKRSDRSQPSVSDAKSAAQQRHAPRPLPLFLELVSIEARADPGLAARALEGLSRYEEAKREKSRPHRPVLSAQGPARLRDCGGAGPPAILVPSLINPPDVLDLDQEVSLAEAIAGMGRRALLLDWGPAKERGDLDLVGHVEHLLLPLLREAGKDCALIGYCLGGTMAIAAANLARVERVANLAAPWRFSAYPEDSRVSLGQLWERSRPGAERLGALPMEVLQSAFWSLDPKRTVSKFARFAELPDGGAEARRFVTLEDWANEGEPLPLPAARELIEDLFGSDLPSSGKWRAESQTLSDRIACPLLTITAAGDRITPEAAAPAGHRVRIEAGHVGMVVGSARRQLHEALRDFLA